MQKKFWFSGLLVWCVYFFIFAQSVEAVLPLEYAVKREALLLKAAHQQRQEASEVLFIHVISSKITRIDDEYCPEMEERNLRVRVLDVKKTDSDIKTGDVVNIIYKVCVARTVGPKQFFPPQLKPGYEGPAFLSCTDTICNLAAGAWSFTSVGDFNAQVHEIEK